MVIEHLKLLCRYEKHNYLNEEKISKLFANLIFNNQVNNDADCNIDVNSEKLLMFIIKNWSVSLIAHET
jgi:hypothetical protein